MNYLLVCGSHFTSREPYACASHNRLRVRPLRVWIVCDHSLEALEGED